VGQERPCGKAAACLFQQGFMPSAEPLALLAARKIADDSQYLRQAKPATLRKGGC
jgi:hypothetical protein